MSKKFKNIDQEIYAGSPQLRAARVEGELQAMHKETRLLQGKKKDIEMRLSWLSKRMAKKTRYHDQLMADVNRSPSA